MALSMFMKIEESIAQMKMNNISNNDMVILSPIGFIEQYLVGTASFYDFYKTSTSQSTKSRRNLICGVLIIEDSSVTSIVVKSLISGHRIEVEE